MYQDQIPQPSTIADTIYQIIIVIVIAVAYFRHILSQR
jgi:hypothetical protein